MRSPLPRSPGSSSSIPEAVPAGYRLVRPVAVGGPSEVWLAEAPDGRRAALKRLVVARDEHPDLHLRLAAEGRLLRTLGGCHHLVSCEAVTETPAELVLEWCEGGDLAAALDAQGPLAPSEAVRITRQVADAVAWLHAHGVYHRDVKPSNVVRHADGAVRLVDLGVAAHGTPPRGLPAGWVEEETGTAPWRAPELAAEPSTATRAVDVYGLGALLHALVTGVAPRPGMADPKCPARLAAVVRRATAMDPMARYHTAADLVDALGPVHEKEASAPS